MPYMYCSRSKRLLCSIMPLDLSADGTGVHVLLQDLAQGEDVALGLGVAEVAHEEPLHIVQLGLEDAARRPS